MPIYILLALSAALFFSLNAIWLKLTSKHAITDRNTLVSYFHITGLIFLPLLLLLTKLQNPMPALWPLAMFTLTFFLGNFIILTIVFRYDISVLHPFFHFQSIFSVGLAWLVLGEVFPRQTYVWIALIIVGGFLVSLDERTRPSALLSKHFLLFLLGILAFAVSDIYAKKTLAFLDFYNLKFWSGLALPAIALLVAPPQQTIRQRQAKPLFFTALSFFLGTLLLFSAFSYNVTISQPLAMFGSLFTLLISIVISRIKPDLLENHTIKVYTIRAIGIALMLGTTMILVRHL